MAATKGNDGAETLEEVSLRPTGNFDAWTLPPTWLLHDDGHVVAVCKPAGVSVIAPERGASHDLLARIRRARIDGDYLCAHSHLDRDVSGVVVLAADRASNPSLARQLERGGDHTFLACLTPKGALPGEGTLHAWASKDRAGVVRPVGKATRGAKQVHVHYRTIDECDGRYVVEARSDDGARGIRAVLAGARAAIAGDGTFEGPCAPRLMLHLSRTSIEDPRSGEHLTFDAPVPWVFGAWLRGQHRLADFDQTTLETALLEAAASRYAVVADGNVDAVRLVHGEGDAIEGLDIEWFGRHTVIWIMEHTADEVANRVVAAVRSLYPAGVYLKVRPKQASRITGAKPEPAAQPSAVWGVDAPAPMTVLENGLKFHVHLGDGLSTGLFVDQRGNRKWLHAHSKGRSVLNLFAYTCSFSVAAAAGGACRTVSVDISKRYLDIGRRNFMLNALEHGEHAFICEDVAAWVDGATGRSERFDVVVLDPPSFGTSHRGRFSATRDYVGLAAACMKLVEKRGGVLLACTNHRGISFGKLRSWLFAAARQAGRTLESLDNAPAEPDFPVSLGKGPHMKAVRCELGPPNADGQGRSTDRTRTKRR